MFTTFRMVIALPSGNYAEVTCRTPNDMLEFSKNSKLPLESFSVHSHTGKNTDRLLGIAEFLPDDFDDPTTPTSHWEIHPTGRDYTIRFDGPINSAAEVINIFATSKKKHTS